MTDTWRKAARGYVMLLWLGGALACGETSQSKGVVAPTAGQATAPGGAASGQAGKAAVPGTGGQAGDAAEGPGGNAASCDRCRDLPHVRPEVDVDCRDGECVYVAGSCEDGFGHCSGDYSEVGCESDLSQPAHCGRCTQACNAAQVCLVSAGYVCSTCSFPATAPCGNACSDLQNDGANCGACGQACEDTQICRMGACVDCESGVANCKGLNRCESSLLGSANCGSCGRDCSGAARFGWCAPEDDCQPLACKAGHADCDAEPDECEAELGQTNGCGPRYVGTTSLSTDYEWLSTDLEGKSLARGLDGQLHQLAPDGQLLWTYSMPNVALVEATVAPGGFTYTIGYETFVRGEDVVDRGVFIAKLNPDGTPAWQGELMPSVGAGQADYQAMAADDTGKVSFAVRLLGDVDVDPTTTVDLEHFDAPETWLFGLTPEGEVAWVRALGDGVCPVRVENLARNPDHILMTGSSSCTLGDGTAPPNGDETSFIARLSAIGGTEVVRWLSGDANVEGDLVLYPNAEGSALSGTVYTELFLGDAPLPLARVGTPSAFVLRFSSSLDLRWLKVTPEIGALAAGPDGGLLGMIAADPTGGGPKLLTLWRDDGSSEWTMKLGCHWPSGAGSTGASFAVRAIGQTDAASCDLDPGPEIATTPEASIVVLYEF